MQRITISIDEALGGTLDALLGARGYRSRSEGMRDLVREAVEAWRIEQHAAAHCVASLSYIYNGQTRTLAQRLSDLQHAHHDLVAAATLVHLDHDHTLETVILRGETTAVRAFADQLRAERGVRFAALNLIGVDADDHHSHPGAHDHAGHVHLSPKPG